MPSFTSPHRSAEARRSLSPLPPAPPPKSIDLNSSTRSTDRDTGNRITRRAFLCDLVVQREGEETTNLLPLLGEPLAPVSTFHTMSSTTSQPATPSRRSVVSSEDDASSSESHNNWSKEKQMEMATRLSNLIEELVKTERSYLSRIEALKKSYADPLRSFARQDYSKIIPMYEAKTIFTNIDAIVLASTAFLVDLEAMFASGRGEDSVGDVALRHLKDLKTFEPYRAYLSKQDESQKMFQEVLKKYSSFASYIERTKYQTTGLGNIGLRELLMEPVQRIPRYTLLWQTMVKSMPPFSTQRAKLLDAIEIASRIAKCEPDPQTVRATVMYCLERNVEGFPANLFSSNRDYLDSIDVDDLPIDYQSSPANSRQSHTRPMSITSASTSASTPSLASVGSISSNHPTTPGGSLASNIPLHCTLVLFDDKIMIVKRQASGISGRKVTGLDDIQGLVRSGGGVAVLHQHASKKDKLSYRGTVDVLDVTATDIGGGDFHLFFERPPTDQRDRWAARPLRHYVAVQPPFGVSLDPVNMRKDKLRFLERLWTAQAQARAKILPKELDVKSPPQVLASKAEWALDSAGEAFGRAKVYWNVWHRKEWTEEDRKGKVAVHIDEDGDAPELQISDEAGPFVVIRLQPMSGGLCRISFDPAPEDDPHRRILVANNDVMKNIVTIIQRFGIFTFRTPSTSRPTTPSSGQHRARPSMLNLDTISRNLFGTGTGSVRSQSSSSENFGSTSTRKSRNVLSRSSTKSSRRHSTSPSVFMDEGNRLSRIPSASSTHDSEPEEPFIPPGQPYSKARGSIGQSEIDLNERLDLARKNSKSMATLSTSTPTPAARMQAKSAGELRQRTDDRSPASRPMSPQTPSKSTDFSRRCSTLGEAKDETRPVSPSPQPSGSRPQSPLSATAPLRVRSKSPSPTKSLSTPPADITPRANLRFSPYEPALTLDAMIAATSPTSGQRLMDLSSLSPTGLPTPTKSLNRPASHDVIREPPTQNLKSPTSYEPIRSPPLNQMSNGSTNATSTPIAVPQSPRPGGPREPAAARSLPAYPGLGSGHTQLRVVSGRGRKVSPGRNTMPLKGEGDENVSPQDEERGRGRNVSGSTSKRPHSVDQLSPRKRSPSRSPLQPPNKVEEGKMPDPASAPASMKRTPGRQTPGKATPIRSSGPLTPSRRVSSTGSVNGNLTPQNTGSTMNEEPVKDHPDALVAVEAARQRIVESRNTGKKLKAEIHTLRKLLRQEGSGPAKNLPAWVAGSGSLPRSPHRSNIQRLASRDMTSDEDVMTPSRHSSIKADLPLVAIDETARGVSAIIGRLDSVLRVASSDTDQATVLVGRLARENADLAAEITQLKMQAARRKETQDMLKAQLADVQTEVDVIYEAFNTELDGMFNDAALPPTEAFDAMQRDLQMTKSRRNELALENMKLKRDLEEAHLKREQWARMLREQGIIS